MVNVNGDSAVYIFLHELVVLDDIIIYSLQSLMKELESERERRWKSEEATKKLAEHVRTLQEKGETTIKASQFNHT